VLSRATCSTSARTSAGTGGRPGVPGYVHFLLTRRWCQASSVNRGHDPVRPQPVSAGYSATSRDLGIFMNKAAEAVCSSSALTWSARLILKSRGATACLW